MISCETKGKEATNVAKRLSKMLEEAIQPFCGELALTVDPKEIYPVQGWYRTSPQSDCLRWTAVVRLNGRPRGKAGSYDTMTECIKDGFAVSKPERRPEGVCYHFYVSADNKMTRILSRYYNKPVKF